MSRKMLESGAYPVGVAKLDLKQPIFNNNRESWGEVLDKYNAALESVSSEGELAPQQLHQSRSQLLGECSHEYLAAFMSDEYWQREIVSHFC